MIIYKKESHLQLFNDSLTGIGMEHYRYYSYYFYYILRTLSNSLLLPPTTPINPPTPTPAPTPTLTATPTLLLLLTHYYSTTDYYSLVLIGIHFSCTPHFTAFTSSHHSHHTATQLRRQELPSCNASKDGTSLSLHQHDWCLHLCNVQVCVCVSKDLLTSPNVSWSKELCVKWSSLCQ